MTQEDKKHLKRSFLHSLLAIFIFSLYYVAKDRDIVREYFGDVGYDYTIEGFSYFNSDISSDKKKILIFKIDNDYLSENNLSDGNNGIRYNYTPRFVIANILKELDDTIKENHPQNPHYPQSVFIDYMFAYSGDVDGKITKDDQKLIDALNYYAQFYDIYLPTLPNGIFLEKLKLHPNIHFVSADAIVNSDDIERGYKPYICQNAKPIPNLSIAITSKEIATNDNFICPMPKNIDFNSYFTYRILYKNMSDEYLFKWNNMTAYSANELNTNKGLISEDFKDSIVLIGADYEASGDSHITAIGRISGIFVVANAIATRYYADGYIKMLNPWISVAIYFTLFMLISFYMPKLLQKMGVKGEAFQYLIVLSFMAFIFYILSILLLVYAQSWLNWVIPWAIFQFMDGKTLLKEMWHKLLVWIRAMNR